MLLVYLGSPVEGFGVSGFGSGFRVATKHAEPSETTWTRTSKPVVCRVLSLEFRVREGNLAPGQIPNTRKDVLPSWGDDTQRLQPRDMTETLIPKP